MGLSDTRGFNFLARISWVLGGVQVISAIGGFLCFPGLGCDMWFTTLCVVFGLFTLRLFVAQ
jgi:hypothetical protein